MGPCWEAYRAASRGGPAAAGRAIASRQFFNAEVAEDTSGGRRTEDGGRRAEDGPLRSGTRERFVVRNARRRKSYDLRSGRVSGCSRSSALCPAPSVLRPLV